MALTDYDVARAAANLGDRSALYQVIAQYNDLAGKFETLLAKLDADAGVTDTDYESGVGLTKRITLNGTAPTAG